MREPGLVQLVRDIARQVAGHKQNAVHGDILLPGCCNCVANRIPLACGVFHIQCECGVRVPVLLFQPVADALAVLKVNGRQFCQCHGDHTLRICFNSY